MKILVNIDGPRMGNLTDSGKIKEVLAEVRKIEWTTDVEVRISRKNLGLRLAVADAVSWVIAKYGEVIVVEDDVEIGPEFLPFMSRMLDVFRDDLSIGHISGYNLVPSDRLPYPEERVRLSRIPESYAWATWARAWNLYDATLGWARGLRVSDLHKQFESLWAALVWKINFHDAYVENINTWAYRWTATLWRHGLYCLTPNRNLVRYTGADDGTHTRTRIPVREQDISKLKGVDTIGPYASIADTWLLKKTFRATPLGFIRRVLESLALWLIRIMKTPKNNRR